jgi:hypothetical protein
MLKSEGRTSQSLCHFISANNLDGALRSHKWAVFARGTTGKKYKINKYGIKLEASY